MAQALSLGLAHEIAIDAPFVDDAQERRDSPGCRAEGAVRADAVVHEPAGGGCTAASAASAASGATRFTKRESTTPPHTRQRPLGDGRGDACLARCTQASAKATQSPLPRNIDRTVAAAKPQRAAALSDLCPERFAIVSRLSFWLSRSAATGRPSAWTPPSPVCASSSASRFARQAERDRTVAGVDAPIASSARCRRRRRGARSHRRF